MLRWMYGRSRCSSCGATDSRWTPAGISAPAMIDTSASRPTPITGRAHPLNRMLTRNRTAHTIAINISRFSAGSCAWMSV
jgi:hypothetical protein